jgi:hypothetical protein
MDLASRPVSFAENLRICRYGVVLSLLSILFGFALGGAFGAFESSFKSGLADSAREVRESVYRGDDAQIESVLAKSWSYYKRAHMHGAGIGNSALLLVLLLAALRRPSALVRRVVSLGLGVGAVGYPLFWLWAGRLAPSLGGTGAAKDALEWLAVPSAGLLLLGLLAVSALAVIELFSARPAQRT